jgi:hypothetical protein
MTAEAERRFVAFVDSAAPVEYLLDETRERARAVTLDVVVPTAAVERAVRRAVAAADVPTGVAVAVRRLDPDPAAWREHLSSTAADRVFVDPALAGAGRLRTGVDVAVERLPADRPGRRRPLVHDGGPARFAATFLLSYLFYLALGDPFDPFDLVTGVLVAGLVAGLLSSTLFESPPRWWSRQ